MGSISSGLSGLMKSLRAVVNLSWHHAHCDKVDEQL